MSTEQVAVADAAKDGATPLDVEASAARIAAEIQVQEATLSVPCSIVAAVEWRRICASLADRAEIVYRVARAHATLKAIALPKDDPRGKNEEGRKALVDLETWHHKTLVTRAQVLSEAALHMVRYHLGEAGADTGASAREAA